MINKTIHSEIMTALSKIEIKQGISNLVAEVYCKNGKLVHSHLKGRNQ